MRCGAVWCSPRHSGSLSVKTGNLGLPKRGAGNLKANLGVPPVSSRPGRAASGPGAWHIMLRFFLGRTLVESSMDANFCPAAKLGSRTGRSSDLDVFYCGIQALESDPRAPGPRWKRKDRRLPVGAWARCGVNDDKAIVRRLYNPATRPLSPSLFTAKYTANENHRSRRYMYCLLPRRGFGWCVAAHCPRRFCKSSCQRPLQAKTVVSLANSSPASRQVSLCTIHSTHSNAVARPPTLHRREPHQASQKATTLPTHPSIRSRPACRLG